MMKLSLKEYQKKREFTKTPEPKGREISRSKGNRFVVQEHHARNLHYDFRLEMSSSAKATEDERGVLKSWAVPKGVPTEVGIKRLAIQVEDHPVDYINFEGEIPEGLYGAGKVIIWDKGTYQLAPDAHNSALEALKNGRLRFVLSGEKLKGKYALIRMKNREKDNLWLLFKK